MDQQGCQTVEVPFIQIGNRRCLSDRSIAEQPWVGEFRELFRHCFERDDILCVWWFYPPDAPPPTSKET